jgi:hypothetical protein
MQNDVQYSLVLKTEAHQTIKYSSEALINHRLVLANTIKNQCAFEDALVIYQLTNTLDAA